MKSDGNGGPQVGDTSVTLGVRVPMDIQPDSSGMVQPANGGMSVVPSLKDLPARMIPARLRNRVPGAAGRESLSVWGTGEGLFVQAGFARDLSLRPDPQNPRHGFVEPDVEMALDRYRAALSATRPDWSVDEK
jgi:hypothetical protein